MAIHIEEDFCDFRAFCEKKTTVRSSNICVIRDICVTKEKPASPSFNIQNCNAVCVTKEKSTGPSLTFKP